MRPLMSALVIVCSAFPAHAVRTVLTVGAAGSAQATGKTGATRRDPPAGLADLGLPVAMMAVAALVWWISPEAGVVRPVVNWWWLLVAVCAAPVAIAVEIGLGFAVAKARRQQVARIRLHERAPGRSIGAVLSVVVVAVAEEVIFRGVAQYQLTVVFGWPGVAAIIVVAALYALNHLYFGWLTVGQKALTGVLLGVVYFASEYSLLVPVIAHVAQNILVLVALPAVGSRR